MLIMKAYWIINKQNNAPAICGSIKAVSKFTEIGENSLYQQFSRNKITALENDTFRIEKLTILKTGFEKK